MKNLFSIAAVVLAFATTSMAQDNLLKVNQVLSLNSTTPVTVPAGKVWKVVTYLQHSLVNSTSTSTTCNAYRHRPLVINAKEFWFFHTMAAGSYSNNFTPAGNQLPIWLPEGSTIAVTCADDIASIIEFNVVPE